ncbi:MAG: STAS domain-containing protein [Micavibrio sp.]|nr:STAS domain-containing protein [Micavibrio sp.]
MMASHMFEVQTATNYALIRFSGFIDAGAVQQIKPLLQQQLPASTGNIVVDLEKVEFLDSHGVGLFVSLLKRAHQNNGRLVLAVATGQPAAVLQMVGFNGELVSYCASLEEAKRSFAS